MVRAEWSVHAAPQQLRRPAGRVGSFITGRLEETGRLLCCSLSRPLHAVCLFIRHLPIGAGASSGVLSSLASAIEQRPRVSVAHVEQQDGDPVLAEKRHTPWAGRQTVSCVQGRGRERRLQWADAPVKSGWGSVPQCWSRRCHLRGGRRRCDDAQQNRMENEGEAQMRLKQCSPSSEPG